MEKNDSSPFWYDDKHELSTGCATCPDLALCGGLRIETQPENCMCFCQSNSPERCKTVCKCNTKHFVARLREVDGWELDLPKTKCKPIVKFPSYTPMIRSNSKRSQRLVVDSIAIPLDRIISRKTGSLSVKSREDLCNRVLVDPSARIILSGVHIDHFLEHYWEKAREQNIAAELAKLQIDLVTTPNFSVFCDVPRWDNFHNMKRIAICWYELAQAGLPVALHINGRTDRDFERWTEFLVEHKEVTILSFEFQTGPKCPGRATWYVKKLVALANSIDRPISLIIHAGINHLQHLQEAFQRVTLVDSTPYLKASNYKQMKTSGDCRVHWLRADQKISRDSLLKHNIRAYGEWVNRKNSRAA